MKKIYLGILMASALLWMGCLAKIDTNGMFKVAQPTHRFAEFIGEKFVVIRTVGAGFQPVVKKDAIPVDFYWNVFEGLACLKFKMGEITEKKMDISFSLKDLEELAVEKQGEDITLYKVKKETSIVGIEADIEVREIPHEEMTGFFRPVSKKGKRIEAKVSLYDTQVNLWNPTEKIFIGEYTGNYFDVQSEEPISSNLGEVDFSSSGPQSSSAKDGQKQ